MIAIGDALISEDLIERDFVCNLSACKGACCIEGEQGAPLEEHEQQILADIFDRVKPHLRKEGLEVIAERGLFVDNTKGGKSTPLVEGGACAYVLIDEKGVTKCGIEKAYEAGDIDFQKPVSCHLYPIRITKYDGYEAVNYSKWDLCNPACELGKQLSIPIYRFVKAALVRKYGQEFYDQLDQTAKHLRK